MSHVVLTAMAPLRRPVVRQMARGLCGWALALAHAKSGDPAMIAGYCGNSEAIDEAIGKFAMAYAKQTDQDHEALDKARRSGRIRVAAQTMVK